MKECKRCADNYYADEGASQCKQCPPGDPLTIRKEMEDQDIDEVLIEKCLSKPCQVLILSFLSFDFAELPKGNAVSFIPRDILCVKVVSVSFYYAINIMYAGDKGEGCASQTFKNQYGVFELNWNEEDNSTSFDCEHDRGRKAVFTCKRDKKNELHMYFEPVYYCQKTAKTNDIEKLANEVTFKIQ